VRSGAAHSCDGGRAVVDRPRSNGRDRALVLHRWESAIWRPAGEGSRRAWAVRPGSRRPGVQSPAM